MSQTLTLTTIVVRDYDEAIDFYVEKLGFEVRVDEWLSPAKRWVVVAPSGVDQAGLLLARAVGDEQISAIGNQAGGRVFLFLQTEDFDRDHAVYQARGVTFAEEPRLEPYGKVAVFQDLYGNKWDLIEPAPAKAVAA
ncbi:VOC family protein [Novosphingopyxis sp.]|uniref:VOC family protein n=1 Tax=Novosphingopyxis sp. TaxID=2709690 RepID=UPI003B5937DB